MERILVVEDEPIIARDIEDSLHHAGYAVSAVASSGEEALSKITLSQPDLVLMDIVLKGRMDGLETAAAIRARFDIPVVYLTGYADEQTLERAKLTYPFGYLLKPFNDRELQVTIAMALYRHERDRRDKERTQWFGAALQTLGQAVLAADGSGRVLFMNRVAELLTGWTREEALGQPLGEVLHCEEGEPAVPAERPDARASSDRPSAVMPQERMLLARNGRRRPVTMTSSPITDEQARPVGLLYVFHESGEAPLPTKARERVGKEGLSPLSKTVHGFIPICASCKKMRDEQGAWHQPESYIKERTGTEFTHGICPDCMRRIYKLTKDRTTS